MIDIFIKIYMAIKIERNNEIYLMYTTNFWNKISVINQQVGVCVFAILNIHPFSALSESVNVPSKVFPSSALVIPFT